MPRLQPNQPRNPLRLLRQLRPLRRRQPHQPQQNPQRPAPAAAKPGGHKTLGQNPNRQLFKRSTYAGVTDTGPVPGETFEQKVARLRAVSAAAKQRAEEGGGSEPVATAPTAAPVAEVPAARAATETAPAATETAPAATETAPA